MADHVTFQYANGSYVRTGRIEACVDNTFYPVCAIMVLTLHYSHPLLATINWMVSAGIFSTVVSNIENI